jgi:hypothetical protein
LFSECGIEKDIERMVVVQFQILTRLYRGGSKGPLKESEDYVRFEVFTAVTMKNAVFWDIKTQFVPDRRHITFPQQSTTG